MRFTLEKATDGKHKYVGVFTDDNNNETRVSFGAQGYEDMTTHKNPLRRSAYLARHRPNEDWYDMYTKGSLSRWILWDTGSLSTNVERFKRRFNLR
jgi:hypothetical protein